MVLFLGFFFEDSLYCFRNMLVIVMKILTNSVWVPFSHHSHCAAIVFVIIPILNEMTGHSDFSLPLYFLAGDQVQHCISSLLWRFSQSIPWFGFAFYKFCIKLLLFAMHSLCIFPLNWIHLLVFTVVHGVCHFLICRIILSVFSFMVFLLGWIIFNSNF